MFERNCNFLRLTRDITKNFKLATTLFNKAREHRRYERNLNVFLFHHRTKVCTPLEYFVSRSAVFPVIKQDFSSKNVASPK